MLAGKRARLVEQLAEIQDSIDFIDAKQRFYDDVLSGATLYVSVLIPSAALAKESEEPGELKGWRGNRFDRAVSSSGIQARTTVCCTRAWRTGHALRLESASAQRDARIVFRCREVVMSIGQVIKVVREERGLTQSQFAHELFVTQQALSRWEKGTAEPSIDMIRLISTRFEVPMARLMEMPDNGFCQSCAMPFYRPEDHGTEPDGTRNGDYCNYCYEDGVFLQAYANSDELVAACAPMMAESCHISVEQAEDCMSALLPNLKRWRRQDEIDAVAEGK